MDDVACHLQLLDRYTEAQALLDAAREDAESRAASVLPSMAHARMWQDFCGGRLADAEADASGAGDPGGRTRRPRIRT
ncbi:hypothetical protein [Streptomyces sp. MBT65]|uniref:hypothetical protein n=1 Tax=Streptomyces sp. MBT65 TaxID=1488395 RepID=UPI00190DD0E8|nr:hypothetical protein [Streptomyces sp. MBT65]